MFSNEITKTFKTSKTAAGTTNKSTSSTNDTSNGTTITYKQVASDPSLPSYALSQRGQLITQAVMPSQQPYSSTTAAYFPAVKATATAKGPMSATVNAMTGGKALF
ncbi:hypothetical protein HDU78_006017 [Chytriomyces hyalinus]|nr:hypothetical protein HDU78_006017 [Chytriomyces hyalinus]